MKNSIFNVLYRIEIWKLETGNALWLRYIFNMMIKKWRANHVI